LQSLQSVGHDGVAGDTGLSVRGRSRRLVVVVVGGDGCSCGGHVVHSCASHSCGPAVAADSLSSLLTLVVVEAS
jgi:hypothetical protein